MFHQMVPVITRAVPGPPEVLLQRRPLLKPVIKRESVSRVFLRVFFQFGHLLVLMFHKPPGGQQLQTKVGCPDCRLL